MRVFKSSTPLSFNGFESKTHVMDTDGKVVIQRDEEFRSPKDIREALPYWTSILTMIRTGITKAMGEEARMMNSNTELAKAIRGPMLHNYAYIRYLDWQLVAAEHLAKHLGTARGVSIDQSEADREMHYVLLGMLHSIEVSTQNFENVPTDQLILVKFRDPQAGLNPAPILEIYLTGDASSFLDSARLVYNNTK